MNRRYETVNALQSSLQGLIFFILINFYWVFKNPHWANLPSWSVVFNPILMATAVFVGFFGKLSLLKMDRSALYFAALFAAIPLTGNVSDFLFDSQLAYDWSSFVEVTDQDNNTFYGFRTYIFTAVIFLVVARSIAGSISEKHFLIVVFVSAMMQAIWALSQVIYFFFPDVLHVLPVVPKQECAYGGGDCLSITRATGLLLNPFYFTWFYFSVYLCFALLSSWRYNILFVLFGFLSMSRSFIACSAILVGYEFKRNAILVLVLISILSAFSVYYWGEILAIIDLRLESDISAESRSATNLLALKELMAGNLLGVGWAVNHYTDSSYSILLLKSGVPGVVLYLSAWIIFYKKMFFASGCNPIVFNFSTVFFLSSFFISSVESHPGYLVVFILYWMLLKRNRGIGKNEISVNQPAETRDAIMHQV